MSETLETRAHELLKQVNHMPPTTSRTVFYAEETVIAALMLALAASTSTEQSKQTRPYPDLLSPDENEAILERAEQLWKDLRVNNLGGFSGSNRPFWIVAEFKSVIEEFGRRDVGLQWSKNDLDAALTPPPPAGADDGIA